MKENFMTYEDGNLQGQLGMNFMCTLLVLKGYLKTYLEIERATIPLPFTTDSGHGF